MKQNLIILKMENLTKNCRGTFEKQKIQYLGYEKSQINQVWSYEKTELRGKLQGSVNARKKLHKEICVRAKNRFVTINLRVGTTIFAIDKINDLPSKLRRIAWINLRNGKNFKLHLSLSYQSLIGNFE